MKIRVLGAGWYGCVIALELIKSGHEVEVHELADQIFAGASGNNPARLHLGPHYPRSGITRRSCQSHFREFMDRFGDFTRAIPVNIYAVAEHDSLIDFESFKKALRSEIEFLTVERPAEFGLKNVEGAIICGERHIVLDEVKAHFEKELQGRVHFGVKTSRLEDTRWDWTIDATFSAYDELSVERFEPCLTVLLSGPTHRAVTIMDGKFGSVYPWNADKRLCSLTHAELTPFSKSIKTWAGAKAALDELKYFEVRQRALTMIERMAEHWPQVRDYKVEDYRFSIRAIQRSAADSRTADIARVANRVLRVRAGKISGVFPDARQVVRMVEQLSVLKPRPVPVAVPKADRRLEPRGAQVWKQAASVFGLC